MSDKLTVGNAVQLNDKPRPGSPEFIRWQIALFNKNNEGNPSNETLELIRAREILQNILNYYQSPEAIKLTCELLQHDDDPGFPYHPKFVEAIDAAHEYLHPASDCAAPIGR